MPLLPTSTWLRPQAQGWVDGHLAGGPEHGCVSASCDTRGTLSAAALGPSVGASLGLGSCHPGWRTLCVDRDQRP